jgi:hypothetical protein
MTTTPYVYNFNPGGRTIPRFIKGIYDSLNYTGPHHWEVVDDADTDTTGWTKLKIKTKAGPEQFIRFVLQGNYLEAYHTPPGGTESPFSMISGGLIISSANSLSIYGISGNSVYVVELEDAICIYNEKVNDSSGILTEFGTGSLGASYIIGRIYTPHGKNPFQLEYGIIAGGILGVSSSRNGSNVFALHFDAVGEWTGSVGSSTAKFDGISMSMLYTGVNTIGENGWIRVGSFTSMNREKANPASAQSSYISDIGNNSFKINRLVPVGVTGPLVARARNLTWGSRNINKTFYESGHFGFTRYWRAFGYGIGEAYPSGDIYNYPWQTPTNAIQVANIINVTDNIGWRFFTSNYVVIWCKGGQEVNVGTITI